MKYTIVKNENTKHGYVCIATEPDGSTREVPLNSKTSDNCLKMPQEVIDFTNRKYISLSVLEKVDSYEVEHKDAITSSSSSGLKQPKFVELANYLSDEDAEVFKQLMQKATENYAQAHAHELKLKEIEKKRKQLEELSAQLAQLEAQENE